MEIATVVGLDPEQAVLVAALRGLPGLPPIDDELRLAAVTSWHRLEGILAAAVDSGGDAGPDLHAHLQRTADATATRWDSLRRRLVPVLDAWDAADVPATLLKGAALVEGGLVAAAARPMADVDVLLPADRAEVAHAIAHDHGFSSRADERTWDFARTRHHHLPALHDGAGTVIEVHHRLLDASHPQHRLDRLVRGRTRPLPDVAAARPDDVSLWLHLAVHFWDDRRRGTGGPLLQLRDLAVLVGTVDLDDLVATARQAGAAGLVGTVASVLEVVVPSELTTTLRRCLSGPAPDSPRVREFVEQRVLGRRSALPQLVHPTGSVAYTPWRLATRLRRQLVPPLGEIRRALGPTATRRDHLRSLAPAARDAANNPGTTLRDLRLDRWSHGVTLPDET